MNATWKTLRIGDLGRVVTGKTPSSERPEEFGDAYPFITPSDIDNMSKFAIPERFLSEAGATTLRNALLPANAVCVVCIGATIGKVIMTDRPSLTNQQINSVIVDRSRFDPSYVYYLCKAIADTFQMFAGGAATPIINKTVFSSIKVKVPDTATQQRVAAVLSSLDDLIANNQRRIALLETMAEETYREWFVRMRFPGYAEINRQGLQPEGWTLQPIGELAELVKRGISPAYDDQPAHKVINQKCIRNGRLSIQESRNHSTVTPDEKLIRYGDVLINSTGVGTLGRSAVFDLNQEGVTCDSHVTILRPKNELVVGEFLAYSIQLMQSYFEAMASGSTGQAELSRELISRTKLLVPTEGFLKAFAEMVRPIRRQRRTLLDQTEKLAQMRDQLLPRLISGKLRVDHLDIQYPPCMKAELAKAA